MPPKSNHTSGSEPNGIEPPDVSKADDDVPACQSCRKKKARCDRAQPCSQCVRFKVSCLYDDRRMKPGLRAGAVDQLYRRIETLENMFLGQEMLWQQIWQALHPNSALPIPMLNMTGETHLEQRREQSKACLLELGGSAEREQRQDVQQVQNISQEDRGESPRPVKRRRRNEVSDDDLTEVLPPEVMIELVDFYYVNIHPWIPVLHVAKFRERMQSPEHRSRIACVLHAIIAVCARFSQSEFLKDNDYKIQIAKKSRQKVILECTETFSVENLQALAIIAFETIGRGRGPSSWSIVGSMVGTVEKLQLGVEEDALYQGTKKGETLIRRMVFLNPSESWSETEERRRVFWTVFLMDRFCSVSTGWKISLTSGDVKRRLPCEGALWEKEQAVEAPYFGISDSRGNAWSSSALNEDRASSNPQDQDAIGGFAYNIEATESLALVTNFFLHHAFVVSDSQKVRMWLMKFKELDLRLIQWKLYLPLKWREASVLNSDGVMDPNLTLAHITHNTAVILLHQAIAYPPAHWQACAIKLPSSASAETCLEAASEIATIGHQFLTFSPIFTNPQFSFCLFIAGRMLLAHARYNAIPLTPVLDTLIASLLEISHRWTGKSETSNPWDENLAAIFAERLIEAQNNSDAAPRPSLDIRQTAYSDESKEQPSQKPSFEASPPEGSLLYPEAADSIPPARAINKQTLQEPSNIDQFSLAFPPLPPAFQQDFPAMSRFDPISLFAQTSGNTVASTMAMDPAHQKYNTWQGPSVNIEHGIGSPQDNPFQVFCLTPSPGQRISRYGGTIIESQIANTKGSNI
ncbi:hypothetical protein N7462_008154 [Penicillium macrosclerotiorum]|uniref:uncharacterized protein n=1 Tax=Penicillium macrosclerotiorum TaxID=303699 RepID=UPI002548BA34|nr:uncharacterized protein N7462_008154 [Penicillium macrosclerotiorum]KAJ5679910.1 hypothetical protein N7462_008154 [Penicillium macrosclerotiorum]